MPTPCKYNLKPCPLHFFACAVLSLTLPTPVLSDDAKCKWDKKRHVLTLTMPVEPPAVVS